MNGKRNGKGKVYDYEGGLIYEGEYSDGKRINGIEYEGNIKKIYYYKLNISMEIMEEEKNIMKKAN